MILLKYVLVLTAVAMIAGALRIMHMFRARAMRALAAKWGFQYIGPQVPKWWNPSHLQISPPLPGWLSGFHPTGRRIRQIWNVIEGQQDGALVLVFDTIVGLRGGAPCTFIACQTETNPFGTVSSPDRIGQFHGWAVLYGICFLWFSWMMSIKRIDDHLNKLRLRSVLRA